MKLWNKVKRFVRRRAEENAKMEVWNFMLEGPFYRGAFGDFPQSLKRREERLAHKKDLTANYTYQPDDDLLAKKQDFMDQYTVNEREQYNYFVKNDPFKSEFRARAWRNHEQLERREGQKAWRVVQHRNHREHMRQKFMNQKTR